MKSRLLYYLIFFALGFLFAFALWYALTPHKSGELLKAPELTWKILGELDYITGQASSQLKGFHERFIKIPGFMVPLEDQAQQVTEFLLVPTPQACIHMPPPPPNQMVLVHLQKAKSVILGPIWVYGIFKIENKRHIYGESSFSLEAQEIEPYK